MKLKNLLIILTFSLTIGCSVNLFPTHNPTAIAQVEQLSTSIENLYETIQQSSDKGYSAYQSFYQSIDAQIHDILVLDSSRKNSGRLLKIANDLQERFHDYENYHKFDTDFTRGEAEHFELGLKTFIKDLNIAENNYKTK